MRTWGDNDIPRRTGSQRVFGLSWFLIRDVIKFMRCIQRVRVIGPGVFRWGEDELVLDLTHAKIDTKRAAATQAGAGSTSGEAFGEHGMLEAPAAKTYTLAEKLGAAVTLSALAARAATGTCTIRVLVDGGEVAELAVSATKGFVAFSAAAPAGSTISIAISDLSACTDLSFSLVGTVD